MLGSWLRYLCLLHLAWHFTYFTGEVLFLQFTRAGEHFGYKWRHSAQYVLIFWKKYDSSATTTQDPPGGLIGSQRCRKVAPPFPPPFPPCSSSTSSFVIWYHHYHDGLQMLQKCVKKRLVGAEASRKYIRNRIHYKIKKINIKNCTRIH